MIDQALLEKRIAADPKGFASWIASWFRDESDPEPLPAREGKAYALVVGLDRVDPKAYGGWDGALPSCVADAKAMRALCGRLGYDRIDHLYDASATRDGVSAHVAALARFAKPGDTVLIYQSRHGGRLLGFDGEDDNSIETHCLYDGQMLDDEFAALLAKFKAGVTVIVIMDACHAEGATKSMTVSSGGWTVTNCPKSMPDVVVEPAYRAQQTHYRKAIAMPAAPPIHADIVEMAACGQLESSYSGTPHSQYTGCLLKAMDASPNADYHTIHAQVVRAIRTPQHPKLNGPAPILGLPALRPR